MTPRTFFSNMEQMQAWRLPGPPIMAPIFFKSPAEFRTWLSKNYAKATELLVGFYKRGSGKSSITWPESVEEALCFGWIDGVRKRNKQAWAFFEKYPPWYKRTAIYWVMSANKEETRASRLATLIADCEKQQPSKPLKLAKRTK